MSSCTADLIGHSSSAVASKIRSFTLWEQTFGGDASSVAPIEGVQLCIGVLELKRQLVACADAARHRVTHLGLLVFETIGQRDAGPMFLAGRRAFDWLDIGFGDSRDPNPCGPLLGIDSEGDRDEERLNQIGADSSEDLPIRPAMLTAVQRNQRLALLLGSLFVDNRTPHAVALMYRSRPPIKTSETHAAQLGVSKISVVGKKPGIRSANASDPFREYIRKVRSACWPNISCL
jgi:hypothetical protein